MNEARHHMAGEAHQEHVPTGGTEGTVDLTAHMRTWLGFWAGVKWSVIVIVGLLILLALFRTN
jgi:hypothetical protein